MTPDQIKHMVHRFLMWKLPKNFNPDGGISFEKIGNGPGSAYVREPVGTNLLDATQATAMVEFMTADMELSEPPVIDRIEMLKDRILSPPRVAFTDEEFDRLGELQAGMAAHAKMMRDEIDMGTRYHWAVERRMGRISVLGAEMRAIEDAAGERWRAQRSAPLVADLNGLSA